MQNIVKLRTSCYSLRNPNDLTHVRPDQTTFWPKSLKSTGTQIWNNLPNELWYAPLWEACIMLTINILEGIYCSKQCL